MQQQPSHMMNQGQGTTMPQPPSMITVKDHLYLSDMMSWNLLTIKKANHFMQECQDPEVKQAIQNMMMMHQRHYQRILGHIQKEMSSQMQTSQMQPPQPHSGQPQMGGMQ